MILPKNILLQARVLMPISEDLFLAILAMDAYNRGYNSGVGDPKEVARFV